MKKRRTSEGRQSNALQDLGIGQDVPIADFSDQSDSGGRIGGTRGVDEFGIEGGAAEEWNVEARGTLLGETTLIGATQAAADGVDDFSLAGESESDAIAEVLQDQEQDDGPPDKLPDDLKALIELRLGRHDRIDVSNVSVRVQSQGLVILSGRVRSESESLRVSEIVSALPGVYAIRNQLAIPR
jgi:osmotically-inducible protein OsmY